MRTKTRHIFTGLAVALLLMTSLVDPIYSMAAAGALLIAYFVVVRRQSKAAG